MDNIPDVTFEAFKAVIPEPEPTKLVADKVLLVLFQVKFALCKILVVAFPINIWFAVKVVVPIPPREMAKIPEFVLLTFIFVNPGPEPINLVADKVFVVLSHVKFALCKILVAALPIKI
jgi:hypothetical protein